MRFQTNASTTIGTRTEITLHGNPFSLTPITRHFIIHAYNKMNCQVLIEATVVGALLQITRFTFLNKLPLFVVGLLFHVVCELTGINK